MKSQSLCARSNPSLLAIQCWHSNTKPTQETHAEAGTSWRRHSITAHRRKHTGISAACALSMAFASAHPPIAGDPQNVPGPCNGHGQVRKASGWEAWVPKGSVPASWGQVFTEQQGRVQLAANLDFSPALAMYRIVKRTKDTPMVSAAMHAA